MNATNRPNKALILFTEIFATGGIQRYNRSLCEALDREFPRHHFTVISLLDSAKNIKNFWRHIKVIPCNNSGIKFIRDSSFCIQAIIQCIFNRPDFLICGHVHLSALTFFLKKIFRLKYVVFAIGIDIWKVNSGLRYKGLKEAEFIISISRYTRDQMAKNGIDKGRIVILPCCVDTGLFYPQGKRRDLAERLGLGNRLILLTVGRIDRRERYKGHDIMLEVMRKIDNRYLWLVIGSGNDLYRLQRQAENLGVGSKVRFLQGIEDSLLPAYYNLADLFIMPSQGEGFGIVFLEALACGKPVIAGKRDGSAEPLLDGKLGFLVEPESADEIIQAINLASTVKEDRTSPGYLAGQVKNNFSTQVFRKATKEVFAKILQ